MKNKDSLFKRAYITRTQGFLDISKKTEFWKEFAEENGGTFTMKQTVAGDQKMLVLTFPCNKNTIQFTESDSHPLKISTRIDLKDELEFLVSQKDFFDKIFALFRTKNFKTGDKAFDEQYVIRGGNSDAVIKIFSNTEIRRILMSNNVYSLVCSYDKNTQTAELLCVVSRMVNSKEELAELYRLFCLLIDEILMSQEGLSQNSKFKKPEEL